MQEITHAEFKKPDIKKFLLFKLQNITIKC